MHYIMYIYLPAKKQKNKTGHPVMHIWGMARREAPLGGTPNRTGVISDCFKIYHGLAPGSMDVR